MFVEAYGAEAGNLALRYMATAGVYIGGGIAPKILPAIAAGRLHGRVPDKEPLVDLLRTFPGEGDPESRGGPARRRGPRRRSWSTLTRARERRV